MMTRIASALLAVAALSLPAFSSAHACDGDKAEQKAPSAERAQKNADKAPQKQDKSNQKDDKTSPDQTGKTS